MTECTNEELIQKLETLEYALKCVKKELSINKQLMQRSLNDEPSDSIAIADLTAITDDEISDNPQLVFEHATGTKRGYLSQLVAVIPDMDITPGDIPPAVNSDIEGDGFGGFRYTFSGTTLNLFTS